jgi:DNA-binding NtrC family response regulator
MSTPGILFVDDEDNVLNALRRILRKEKYSVHFCRSVEEAKEILSQNEIDIVVSDHLMPSMNGLAFLKLVKKLYPDIIRVLLTGHADLQMAIEAINEGEVFRFLTKPWNELDLKVSLRQIIDFVQLRRENQILQDTVQKQQALIEKMNKEHPGIFNVERDETGAIILDEDIFSSL